MFQTLANSVLLRIRRSPLFFERYNNTCDFVLNRTYTRYAQECRAAYEAERGPVNLPSSPLFENAAVLIRRAFPAEKARAYSEKIGALIERKDPAVKLSEEEGRNAYIAQPLFTLGADILDALQTTAVHEALLSFFRSHYRIEWVTCFRSLPTEGSAAGSRLWHSDSFPPSTCKMFLHLTPATEDNGATEFMNREDTMAYRRAGYFGQFRAERLADLQEFAREHHLPYRPSRFSAAAGDVTIFDMNFFHRAIPPRRAFRDVVQFFFVPSLVHWEEQLRRDGGVEGLNKRGVTKLPRNPRNTGSAVPVPSASVMK